MKIHVIAFGKLKTPGLREAADYFIRNVQPWAPVIEHELKPVALTAKTPAARDVAQKKEADLFIAKLDKLIGKQGAFFLMDEKGPSLPSREWADRVSGWRDHGLGDVALLIGSSMGFGDAVRRGARGKFSLGPQTLSHELARVVLFEQLYRALSILNKHPYHNEGE